MADLSTIIVEGYHYTGDDLDLNGTDFWALALDQRAFGPRRLVVVTARRDGAVLGLAHCERTEPPELALKCCLSALDDGAVAAVAYSDEPVSTDPPIDLRYRLDTARVAARELGLHLVDWVMCDDVQMRSMRFTLEECNYPWDPPVAGPARRHRRTKPTRKTARPIWPERSRREEGGP